MPGFFRGRTAAIQKAMQEAQKASEEARRKLADIESRLMKLDVEIGMMRDAAEKEAEAEAVRILTAAQEEATKIVAAAEQGDRGGDQSCAAPFDRPRCRSGSRAGAEADPCGRAHRSSFGA